MATTIQISEDLRKELNSKKLYRKETYEEVIWAVLQDIKDLDEETREEIETARKEVRSGKYYTLGEAKDEIGI